MDIETLGAFDQNAQQAVGELIPIDDAGIGAVTPDIGRIKRASRYLGTLLEPNHAKTLVLAHAPCDEIQISLLEYL